MDSRLTYFSLVAEELNMHKAAERAFVSPQGISAAIKSLESEYRVPLFIRSPKLALTTQGEMLLHTVRQIEVLESNLSTMLTSGSGNHVGSISLGILESRYEIVVPDIVYEFIRLYKNIGLEVKSAYSRDLERDIENNRLDMIIAPGGIESPELESIHLIDENFVLLISDSMLHRYIKDITQKRIDSLRKGIYLKDFADVPLIRYPTYTRFYQAMKNYEEAEKSHFTTAFVSNHALSYSRFVQHDIGMAIVSSLFLPRVREQNMSCRKGTYVYAFPIIDLPYCRELNLFYRKDRYLSQCHRDLIDLVKKSFEEQEKQAPLYL